jgi:hypothetical protein
LLGRVFDALYIRGAEVAFWRTLTLDTNASTGLVHAHRGCREKEAAGMSKEVPGGWCFGSKAWSRKRRYPVILAVAVAFLLLTTPLTWGDYIVQTTSDSVSNPAPGSLRYEIYAAEAAGGGTVDATGVIGTITLAGEIDIQTAAVTINGPTTGTLVVNGDSTYRIFVIWPYLGMTINDLTLEYGEGCGVYNVQSSLTMTACTIDNCQGDSGGGIYSNDGSVTLDGCTIKDCEATGADGGGGLYSTSGVAVTLTNCTFKGNSTTDSQGSGAGIRVVGGTIKVDGCAFVGNHGDGSYGVGGGMSCSGSATVTVTNSTFANNTAPSKNLPYYGGGGISNDGASVTVTNCTFSENQAYYGGGIFNHSGAVQVYDTILWGNGSSEITEYSGTVTVANCVVEGGYGSSMTADPLLGTLGNYGGDTETIPLLPGSSAIDAGAATTATATDQRGISRGSTPDIGAFESRGFTLVVSSGTPQTTSVNTAFSQPLVVQVSSDHGEPVMGGAVTFTAPDSGPSATFGTNPVTITSAGTASATATANDVAGSYTVDASTRGATTESFSLTNTGAEMAVKGNGHVIASGDTTPTAADGSAFGSVDIVTGRVDHTFTIASTGDVPLTLSGTPEVAITGAAAADFTVTAQPDSPVAASNGTTTFTIEFNPSAADTRSATVTIASNAGASPYTFAVQGAGVISTGDVNDDGSLNILDVRLCLQIADGVIQGTAAQRAAADVNKDGRVTLADAQLLAEFVAGIGATQ